MENIKIIYNLNEEGRKKSILAGGDGKGKQIVSIPCTEEILSLSSCNVCESGEITIDLTNSLKTDMKIGYKAFDDEPYIDSIYIKIEFSDIQQAEQLISFEKNRLETIKTKQGQLETVLPKELKEYEDKMKKKREIEEEKLATKKENQRKKAEKKAEREKQKSDWIEQYGSDYLKTAFSRGYNCQRKYIIEYVESLPELKGFKIDFQNTFDWDVRVMPSEKALKAEIELSNKGYDVETVWLTSEGETQNLYFENCEAIVIRDFLDKYDLIKKIV